MKTPIRLALLGLCAGFLLCLQAARADDNPPPPPPDGGPGMHQPHLPPGFDQLNLTDAQKQQIIQIIKDTDDERRQKIDGVLTDAQKAQLEQLKKQHHHNGQGGPGKGNLPPVPPPG